MRKISLFYSLEEMGRHMRADANASALARLPEAARAEIAARCGAVLAHFGYAGDPPEAAAAATGRTR